MRPDMAERRRTAGTRPTTRSRTRRPADQDEQEVVDEDETEPMSPDDQESDDEDEEDASDAADRDVSATDSGETSRRAVQRHRSLFTARQAARAALRQILELTEKQAESITGVERGQDGWTVSIEVVEDRRIPSSADILATYETRIDEDGELMSYRRVRRYSRARGDSN
jgi:Gas vesicle synthesis protein GvpO